MGGSIPQPADIHLTWFPSSPFGVCLGQPAAQDAMLNHGIIELKDCVMTILMGLVAAATWATSNQSHQFQELLRILIAEIIERGLTTMLLPCAFRPGLFYCRTSFPFCQ